MSRVLGVNPSTQSQVVHTGFVGCVWGLKRRPPVSFICFPLFCLRCVDGCGSLVLSGRPETLTFYTPVSTSTAAFKAAVKDGRKNNKCF